MRKLNISHEIKRLSRGLELRIAEYDSRERELRRANVPVEKIPLILPPVTQQDQDEVAEKIAALEAEREALGRYLASGPDYPPELLAGTGIEPMIPADAA